MGRLGLRKAEFHKRVFGRVRSSTVRLSSTLERVPELLNLLWGQLLAPAHNAQHLFALDLALPFASRLRFHALAIGLGVEEPRQEFEARIGGGGVARENRRDDKKGLQGAAPAFPAPGIKIAPRIRFNGASRRPARNGESAGTKPMRVGTREFRKELTACRPLSAPTWPATFFQSALRGASFLAGEAAKRTRGCSRSYRFH